MGNGLGKKKVTHTFACVGQDASCRNNKEIVQYTNDVLTEETNIHRNHCPSHDLQQHSVAAEACHSIVDKIKPKQHESLKRKLTYDMVDSMKAGGGIVELIEKELCSLPCHGCSIEEIGITLKTVTANLAFNCGLETDAMKKLADLYSIYFWVANNITYNVSGWADLIKGKYPDVSCEYVLQHRLTVCNGYANVFSALAEEMGFDCVTIDGHFRTSLCDQKEDPSYFSPDKANTHSWNGVNLEGVWHLVDCTYGAGVLSGGCFVSKFTDEYFITPPEQLVFSHWPDDKNWQLLETPLSLHEIQPLQILSPSCFNLGIVRTQFKELVKIDSNANEPIVSVELKIPPGKTAVATISNWPTSDERFSSGYDYSTLVFIHHNDENRATIYAIAHDQGLFQLKLFIRNFSNDSEQHFLCSYLISCHVSSDQNLGFPCVKSHVNGFNLLSWKDPLQTLPHVAECLSGEMNLYFEISDISKLVHFITPGKIINEESAETRLHYYSAIHPFLEFWKLHVVFPGCGLWTICIAYKEFEGNIVPVLSYEVNVLRIKKREGYFSYPWIQRDITMVSCPNPICVNGDKLITIQFTVKKAIKLLQSYLSNDEDDYRHYSNVLNKGENAYELQVVIPDPGHWSVYLMSMPDDTECHKQTLFSCFFDVSSCLKNTFFPIVNHDVVKKYNIEYKSMLVQSETHEFITHLKSNSNKIHIQTRLYRGWTVKNKEANIKQDHSALVKIVDSSTYAVKVLFPEPGKWTLIISVISCSDQTEEWALILNLEAVCGASSDPCVFYKFFPAFYSNQIKWSNDSETYNFEVNDCNEILHAFSASVACALSCEMFQVQEPDTIYTNQTLILNCDTGYTLKALFPATGEWCIRLYCNEELALQLYYLVHEARHDVEYPLMPYFLLKKYQIRILHPTLLFPLKLSSPTTLSFNIQKPFTTALSHEASVSGAVMAGMTQLIPITSNQYTFFVNISKSGSWHIRIFATRNWSPPNAWKLVFAHSILVS